MEELIFFAVIIIFSIIESIARSRKKRAGGPGELPTDRAPEEARQSRRSEGRARDVPTPTYDADPSYDDLEAQAADTSREAPQRYERPYGSTERADTRAGSEGMVPADIWEEIAGLARGRMRQLETPPEPPAPVPAPVQRSAPARDSWGKRAPRAGQEHRVHLSHAGYGTDPSSRKRSEQDGLDPLARSQSADVASVRRQIRQGRHALRQAVILQEILGPPASMRSESLPE